MTNYKLNWLIIVKLCICLFILLNVELNAQSDSVFNFSVSEFRISLKEKDRFKTHYFEDNINNFNVTSDSVFIKNSKINFKKDINSIYKIGFKSGSYFWESLGAGVAAGLILAVLTVPGSRGGGHPDFSGLAYVIYPVGLGFLFAIPGALTVKYNDYDINNVENYKRIRLLNALIENRIGK